MSFSNKLTPPWIFWISKGRSAATNACRLIHGIHLNYRETLLVFFFLHLIRPEILLKEFIISRHRDRQDQFHKRQRQGPLSPEMKNKTGAHCQCRHLQEGRRPWVHEYPPEFQFYKTASGCKAGDKCLFPHHKVDEQPNKKPKKSYNSHKGRKSEDKHAIASVKIVPQLGCVSQDS